MQIALGKARAKYPRLWDGLVGAWCPCLGPTGLTLFDRSGYRNNGTLTAMDPATDWVTSEGRWAIDYDGINDFVDCGSITSLNGISAFSLISWIKPTTLPFGNHLGIFARGTSVRVPWLFGLSGASTLLLQFQTTTGGAADCSVASPTLTAGVWQHFAATWDGVNVATYLNGIAGPTDTTTGSVLANSDGNAWIGLMSGFTSWLGQIDDTRFYSNRKLLAPEVALDYSLGRGGWAQARRRTVVSAAAAGPQVLTVPDASAIASAIAPTVVPGSILLAAPVAAAVASAIAPTVIPGAVTLSVPVVSADASAIAPGISSQAQGTAPANTLWFGDFV